MKKVLKVILYVILAIILIVVGVVVAINTPWGKEQIRKYAVSYLQKKLDTKVEIGKIDFSIPSAVNLSKVLVLDKRQDTMVWVNQLDISINMLKLIEGKISVSKLGLEGADINMYRTATDTNFNYQFVVDSFVGKKEATSKEVVDTAKASPIYIDAGLIEIKNTRYRFNDTIGGALFGIRVNSLVLKPRQIDLNNMRFEVADFKGDNINSYFYARPSSLPPPPEDTSAPIEVVLVVDKLRLNKADFAFKDEESAMDFSIQAKSLEAAMPWFSLLQQQIKINYLNLDQTNSSVVFHKNTQKAKKETPKPLAANDTTGGSWRVWVNDLLFKDVAFAFDDDNTPKLKSGMDYSHLGFQHFYLTGSELMYSADTIMGNVKNLSLNEKSGLDIQTFRTKFIYHQRGAILDELYLKTPQTLIQDKIAVSYRSLESLSKELSAMKLNLALKQSVLSFKDLFIFLPEAQKQQLRDYKNQKVNFTLLADGTVGNLNIQKLLLQGLQQTQVDLSGQLFGLPDADKLRYALNIKNLKSSEKDIHSFVPASVRQQIDIPAWFALSGKINGTTTMYNPDLLIRTSDGNASLKGVFAMNKPGKESYDLYLNAQTFNIGKILRMQDQLGTITLSGKVKGTGFDPKHMNADIDATILQAFYHGYNYTNITALGFLKNQEGQLDLKSKDPNAYLNLQSVFNFKSKYPAVTANMAIDLLDLQALKFMDNEFKFTGDVYANVLSTNPDFPNAELSVRSPFVTSNGKTYMFDSVYVLSHPDNDSMQDIDINVANIINAKLTGKIPLTKMGDALLAHINKYYHISDTVGNAPLAYDMNLSGTLAYHRLFRQVVPELRPFDTIRFFSIINPLSLNIGVAAQRVRYADMYLDTFSFSAVEQDSSLMYVAGLNKFSKGNIQFYNSSLSGYLRHDSISSFLNLTDNQSVDQFSLGVTTSINQDNDLVFNLQRGLKLNYDDWTVNPLNRIVFGGDKGIYINDLALNQGNQLISVKSKDTMFNSPLNINIQNFAILNLTKMISKDTVLADGKLFVNADLDMRDSFPKVAGDVKIDSLFVMGSTLGNLSAHVKNENAYSYFADARLTGYDNDISIVGNYNLKPIDNNELDFKANFKTFSLKSMEGLTFGNLKNSSGSITGDLDIKGTVANPLIEGTLKTNQLKTTLSMFNTYMSMPEETIRFDRNRGLYFDRFKIYDQYNKLATLSGRLNTKNFTEYSLDMTFAANNWQAMNSTSKDNESIYGKLFLSANIGLHGNMTSPAVDGNITIHDSTDFSYAMLDNPALVANDGIVMFYDGRDSGWVDSTEMNLEKAKYLLSQSSSLNVNVDIQKNAQFTVLIDPETGDRLNVKGTSFLNANLGSDGSMTLTGSYELEDGYYELNYNLLKKKFKIQKGSMIMLAGDPLDAEVNITAVYKADAAPYDLVQKQGQDAADLNQYRQRMPFQVLLKMSGKVLKPTINFDIIVQEGGLNTVNESVKSFVESKLSDMRNNPSDMNKQVVSLLLLGRFIAEDPFSSSGGGLGIENAVRQSASRFLSEQMNRMAGDLIKGIELDFGVNTSEDFSTGSKVNRTDFNITASKRLFNDRLKVTIGNDFALEGQTAGVTNPSYLPGNLSADYLLTPDGKYILRGYRKSELQNIINGYLIETGLSFRFSLEYNRFRSLLMGQERYRAFMRKKREAEAKKLQERKDRAALSITNTPSKP
ncbi:hypothetical protein DBR32_00780 [Taibaiella sp. KBW10]|uniref:translocation/assembly module TamB domain-containing protein n=1 Tax=Taibaiella sp. KBW10 TaxID=2153357 RepID=UPI000F5A2B8C|nr:translocation/assembly module TamB domain-containing protein [Taibaiella sp. KBW10]RQO32182.1 hypothetical protein DBR32_00780 [Taibaiella sp. KBW10]